MSNNNIFIKIKIKHNDDVSQVVELIRNSEQSHILLECPDDSILFSNIVSLKILLKELMLLDKNLILASNNPNHKKLGSSIGFIVVGSETEITNDYWDNAQRAKLTFKSIYNERKSNLKSKQNKYNNFAKTIKPFEKKIDDTRSVPKNSYEVEDIDAELKPNIDEKKNKYVEESVSINIHEQEVNVPHVQTNNINDDEQRSQNFGEETSKIDPNSGNQGVEFLHRNLYPPLDEIPQIPKKRPSFDELYKEAKMKSASRAKEFEQKKNFNFESRAGVIQRQGGKVIRKNGLTFMAGGDISQMNEFQDEIIKDEPVDKDDVDIFRSRQEENLNDYEETIQEKASPKESPDQVVKKNIDFENISNIIKDKYKFAKSYTVALVILVLTMPVWKKVIKNINSILYNRKTQYETEMDETVRLKKNSKSYRNFIIFLIIFFGIASGSFFFLINYLPKVDIVISAKPLEFNAQYPIPITLESKTVDLTTIGGNPNVQLQAIEIYDSDSQTVTTTGTKDIGTKSSGTITIYNKTDKDINISGGSTVKVNLKGKEYIYQTTSSKTIPKRTIKIIRIDYGFADVKIAALNNGNESNINAADLGETHPFTIGSYSNSELEGISFSGILGGESKIVKMVTETDKTTLFAKTEPILKEKIKNKFIATDSKDLLIVTKVFECEKKNENYSKKIGEISDNLTLNLEYSCKHYAIDKSIFENLAKSKFTIELKNVRQKFNDLSYKYFQKNTESYNYTLDDSLLQSATPTLNLRITGKYLLPINIDSIKSKVKDINLDKIKNIVEQNDYLKLESINYEPNYFPEFLRKSPSYLDKIKIDYKNIEI